MYAFLTLLLTSLALMVHSTLYSICSTDSTYTSLDHLSITVSDFLAGESIPAQVQMAEMTHHLYNIMLKSKETGVQEVHLKPDIHHIAVVGDLHGDAKSTWCIFQETVLNHSFMEKGMVVFLGDYVDRGTRGIQVLASIISAKLAYPDKVLTIRGNHESVEMNLRYGFLDEVSRAYGKTFYHEVLRPLFEILPIGYVIPVSENVSEANRLFFAHGGLPRNATLNLLLKASKNGSTPENPLPKDATKDILWSDPTVRQDAGSSYTRNPRGAGILYSSEFYRDFAVANRLIGMFRGHQVVKDGMKRDFFDHYTVFSTSDYVGLRNTGAYVTVDVGCVRLAAMNAGKSPLAPSHTALEPCLHRNLLDHGLHADL